MQETDEELRSEADELLASGLREILAGYGEVHIMGSYALHLMVWRDLDIHIVANELDRGKFFDLGGRIANLLKPHRMHYRDETIVASPELPKGVYWGVYLGDERDGAWKIDIWVSDARSSLRRALIVSESQPGCLDPLGQSFFGSRRRVGVTRNIVVGFPVTIFIRLCWIMALSILKDFG